MPFDGAILILRRSVVLRDPQIRIAKLRSLSARQSKFEYGIETAACIRPRQRDAIHIEAQWA